MIKNVLRNPVIKGTHKQDLPWMQKDAVILIGCDYMACDLRAGTSPGIQTIYFYFGLYDDISSLKIIVRRWEAWVVVVRVAHGALKIGPIMQ